MAGNLKPSPARAIEFLHWLNPNVPIYLESMASQGKAKPIAKRFSPAAIVHASEFVAASNGDDAQRNMYFLPNAEFFVNGGAKSGHVAAQNSATSGYGLGAATGGGQSAALIR